MAPRCGRTGVRSYRRPAVPGCHSATAPRFLGPVVPWCQTAPGPRCERAAVPDHRGSIVPRSRGTAISPCLGAPARRFRRADVPRHREPTVPWCRRAGVGRGRRVGVVSCRGAVAFPAHRRRPVCGHSGRRSSARPPISVPTPRPAVGSTRPGAAAFSGGAGGSNTRPLSGTASRRPARPPPGTPAPTRSPAPPSCRDRTPPSPRGNRSIRPDPRPPIFTPIGPPRVPRGGVRASLQHLLDKGNAGPGAIRSGSPPPGPAPRPVRSGCRRLSCPAAGA